VLYWTVNGKNGDYGFSEFGGEGSVLPKEEGMIPGCRILSSFSRESMDCYYSELNMKI